MNNHDEFLAAQKLIPGGVDSPVRAFGNVGGEPFMVDRGEGSYIYDVEGKKISRLRAELGSAHLRSRRRGH